MSPTQTHLDLLRQLPDEVAQRLRKCGPGWARNYCRFDGEVIPWVLWDQYLTGSSTWTRRDPEWLPCNPLDILGRWGGLDRAAISHGLSISLTPVGGACRARVGCVDINGRSLRIDRIGNDPHEAALRLLLAVCGGEE